MSDNATQEPPATKKKPTPAPKSAKRRSFASELAEAEKRIQLALSLMEAAEQVPADESKLALYRVAKAKLERGQ